MTIFNKDRLAALQARNAKKKKHRILIVDDEERNLDVLASVLEFSYEVLQAKNGTHALQVIEAQSPDQPISMVISDQRMPQMTGVELFEYLSHTMPDTIRIILTGYTDVKAIISSINQGQIYQFILKPFERVEFLMAVKQGIKTYELKKQIVDVQFELKQQLTTCMASYATKERQLTEALNQLESAGLGSEVKRIKCL
ncbi:MAG: response regulator RpfG family c-di-GMP phosphodiesterase [Alteromonadaceae bacterium]|jgi:response regulator RpfG family c-di-GMP phosphodiesterase